MNGTNHTLEQVEDILKEWKEKVEALYSDMVPSFHDLAAFLRENTPILREWMNNYLHANRDRIFLQYCCEHVQDWAIDQVKHRTKIPPTYFCADPIKPVELSPTIVEKWTSIFEGTPARFSIVQEMIDHTVSLWDPCHADDPAFHAIHKNLAHLDYDLWDDWHCAYCHSQETWWHNELIRRMTSCMHPLLNVDAYPTMDGWRREITQWSPPHRPRQLMPLPIQLNVGYFPGKYQAEVPRICTSAGRGWALTPFKPCDHWRTAYEPHTPFQRFIQLWNTLDRVMDTIQRDLPMIIEL